MPKTPTPAPFHGQPLQFMIEYTALYRKAKAAELRAIAAQREKELAEQAMQAHWRDRGLVPVPFGAYIVEGGTHVVLVGSDDYPPIVPVALIEQPPVPTLPADTTQGWP